MRLKRIFNLVLLIFISGCTEPFTSSTSPTEETTTPLLLYMNNNTDGDYYIVDYPMVKESHYTSVEYLTSPTTRVFWDSEDTYTFIYWGRETTYPIITNSTYSNDDGIGRQLIYLYKDHIGDTLSVDGCINETCERLYFIVKGI